MATEGGCNPSNQTIYFLNGRSQRYLDVCMCLSVWGWEEITLSICVFPVCIDGAHKQISIFVETFIDTIYLLVE